MFDLEQSVAKWREQMRAAGITNPGVLDELESHLREEIERQMKSGLNEQQAFEIAVAQIGCASELKMEFKKIGDPMDTRKVAKLAGIICVVTALAGQLFICAPMVFAFALAHGPRLSLMARVLPLIGWATTVAITVLSLNYNHKFLPVIHNQLLRRAIGIVCFVGCLLWTRFALFYLPGFVLPYLHKSATGSISLVLFLLGANWAMIAILGGVGHGLEKVAREKSAVIDLAASQS